jgi:hypothetical protein
VIQDKVVTGETPANPTTLALLRISRLWPMPF